MTAKFAIGWDAGPSAQIEVLSPSEAKPSTYQVKFTPPFRATLRPPMKQLQMGRDLPAKVRADFAAVGIAGALSRGMGANAPSTITDSTVTLGNRLRQWFVTPDIAGELNAGRELFLEIGTDEALIEFPWELLYDDDFWCLKHSIGRFVNSISPPTQAIKPPDSWAEEPLSILLISVPQPQNRNGTNFQLLTAAQAEAEAIVRVLTALGTAAKPEILSGQKATYDAVCKALNKGRYHIVHFSGHAYFDPDEPENSSLVLFDKNIAAWEIDAYLRKPPVLAFMNACETAGVMGGGSPGEYNIFGLGKSILNNGAYLIGTRWKVGDVGAASFAECFYQFLVKGSPLGLAIRQARLSCRIAAPDPDFSWASYVYYGDPRLCFKPIP